LNRELTSVRRAVIPSDLGSTIASLLQCNRDLHDGIDIFAEYFAFVAEEGRRYWLFRPLVSSLETPARRYEFVTTECSLSEAKKTDWNYLCHVALSKDLFFFFWDYGACYGMYTHEEKEFFETEIIPRFKESEGWDLILEELETRENECARLKTLRSLVQQKD